MIERTYHTSPLKNQEGTFEEKKNLLPLHKFQTTSKTETNKELRKM
jgi:hypothetical protein